MPNETIASTAQAFFEACETGQGWAGCSAYCTPNASFSAQAEPLLEVTTLAGYADWMKAISCVFPGASYDLKAFAVDEARQSVVAYAVFHATHTGEGGPVPPTGLSMSTDYVYVMQFDGDKIVHMTKIWNAGLALKAVGWA
jgi:predicted ester cyclase